MKRNHIARQMTLCVMGFIAVSIGIQTVAAEETKISTVSKEKSTVKCDPIYTEVVTAVTAQPDKVLAIVEENTLASSDCVCEIIKAAIHASKADEELTKQIMLTALNAAPEKAKVIEICIASIKAEKYQQHVKKGGKEVVDVRSGKGGKDVQPVLSRKGDMVMADPVTGDDDYYILPQDIRGVYLIQPAAGGIVPPPINPVSPSDPPDRPRPNRPIRPTPLSPSTTSPTP